MNNQRRDPGPRIPIKIEQALAAAVIAVIGIVTFANVISRYVINYSLAFTEEYSIALMVVMTLLGAAAAFAEDKHIRITYFIEKMNPGNRKLAEIFAMLVVACVFGAMTWLGGRMAWDEYRYEVMSPGLGVPQWIYTVWMPVFSLVITARVMGRAMRVWKYGVSGHGGSEPL